MSVIFWFDDHLWSLLNSGIINFTRIIKYNKIIEYIYIIYIKNNTFHVVQIIFIPFTIFYIIYFEINNKNLYLLSPLFIKRTFFYIFSIQSKLLQILFLNLKYKDTAITFSFNVIISRKKMNKFNLPILSLETSMSVTILKSIHKGIRDLKKSCI